MELSPEEKLFLSDVAESIKRRGINGNVGVFVNGILYSYRNDASNGFEIDTPTFRKNLERFYAYIKQLKPDSTGWVPLSFDHDQAGGWYMQIVPSEGADVFHIYRKSETGVYEVAVFDYGRIENGLVINNPSFTNSVVLSFYNPREISSDLLDELHIDDLKPLLDLISDLAARVARFDRIGK